MLHHDIPWHARHWAWRLGLVLIFVMVAGWSRLAGAAEKIPAPAFTLPSSMGGAVQLVDYLGERPILLAFYMGNFWSGCRQQLGELQQHLSQYKKADIVVLAISIDPPATAAKTASNLSITFPLLSDTSASVIRQYQMYSQRMQMANMGYVLIDASGYVRGRANEPKFGAQSPAILQQFTSMKTVK